ncbi:peptidoglycan-binding domain-containing protein [uncultured Aquimarina sp.]|uniref:peptidoglycan-binding domain-containing protein n=1 Tax=uncultured Aquimarina sp. TaxID=575652 RepID=UPI0026017A52|nr:peptidoglycan-binding domain-containing protein [uncultured Aquimarina sp.]
MQQIIKGSTRKKKESLSQKQILMIGLGGGVALGLGYLAYNHFRNKTATRRSFISDPITIPSPDIVTTSSSLPLAAREFPVKRGARGALVSMIQNALLAKGGQAAMIIKETSFRNGRVDGIFGKGTERALRAAGFPSAITQSIFTSLVGKNNTSGFDASSISKEIIDAANKRNLFGVLGGLKKISSVSQYQQVSTFFQGVRITGIRVTSLVNALLSVAFKQKELEKVKIRAEFRRMGLKQNTRGVWFIPGLGGVIDTFINNQDRINNEWNMAIAVKPTLLKATDGSFIVPELAPNTVVGYITGMENGTTRILTQSGETVFAPTRNLSSF